MDSPTSSPARWEADLNGFFATIDRENAAYSHNLTRQGTFYNNIVRPALDVAAEALRRHDRTCETGLDQHRVYLIVRRPDGPVEFQYAVQAEARIENVTPYIHCWFEENILDRPANKQEKEAAEKEQKKDEGEEEADDDSEKDEKEDKKDNQKPARTKTIELLSTWTEGRDLESITKEEILADFTAHYQEALTQLRTHLHIAPPPSPTE